MSSLWRPSARATSTRSARAARRSSSSFAAAERASPSSATSESASPRQRPSASSKAFSASSSSAATAERAVRRSSAKRAASKSQASRWTVYPGARVTITDASPSTPRSRDTYSCTMCRALAGACSPQTESTSASTDTTSPNRSSRTPSSARSRRLDKSTRRPSTSASSGPRIRKVTCVTVRTRIAQSQQGFQHAMERRWSAGGAAPPHHPAHARIRSHRRHGFRRDRTGRHACARGIGQLRR